MREFNCEDNLRSSSIYRKIKPIKSIFSVKRSVEIIRRLATDEALLKQLPPNDVVDFFLALLKVCEGDQIPTAEGKVYGVDLPYAVIFPAKEVWFRPKQMVNIKFGGIELAKAKVFRKQH